MTVKLVNCIPASVNNESHESIFFSKADSFIKGSEGACCVFHGGDDGELGKDGGPVRGAAPGRAERSWGPWGGLNVMEE